MHVQSIKNQIEEIANLSKSKDWVSNLPKRKLEELEFHDRDRDEGLIEEIKKDDKTYNEYYGNKKYYLTTKDSVDYMHNWLSNNVKDKVFLDYACGNGNTGIKAAKLGAELVIGLDISSISVDNATKQAEKEGVGNSCVFVQGDCENTGLPDECIDIIMCNGMLHHLDLSYAFPELRRILKPGGKIFAYEALDYNPIIKLYRLMTPKMRTEWEKNHILSLGDIDFGKHFFKLNEVKYWHITSFIAAAFSKQKLLFDISYSLLNGFDKILSKIPYVRNMAWIFTFVFEKKPKEE